MMYDLLASYYDALVKDEDATKSWVKWIESKIQKGDILELACGSGEITLQLAKDGFHVTAMDLSKQMIKQASLKDVEHKISFHVGNMLELEGYGMYDAILCLCDSFNYLLEDKDVEQFFKEVSEHVKPGGWFFFDTHSLDRLEEFSEEFNETGSFEKCDYQWSITSEQDIIYQDFAFYMPDGTIVQEHHMQRVYDPKWLKEKLEPYFIIESIKTDFEFDGICEGEKYFYSCRRK